jgi:hypothetical protein
MQTIFNMLPPWPYWMLLPFALSVVPVVMAVNTLRFFRHEEGWEVDFGFSLVVILVVWALVLYGRWTA